MGVRRPPCAPTNFTQRDIAINLVYDPAHSAALWPAAKEFPAAEIVAALSVVDRDALLAPGRRSANLGAG
jgi:hypothetical protein